MKGKGAQLLLVLVLLLALLAPRLAAIGQYSVADEGHWLQFSANFYYALSTGDFAHTYQREHPGVLPMWAGTASFLINYPGYRGIGPGYLGSIEEVDAVLTQHGQDPLQVLNTAKMIMAALNVAALLLVYWLLQRMLGTWPALGAVLLIGWAPFYLAHSRLLHLDGLLSSMLLLSVVAFAAYLQEGGWTTLLLSAIAAAGAWLTKSPAVIVLPVVALLALSEQLRQNERSWRQGLWTPLLVWGGVMVAAVFAAWPALWVAPLHTVVELYKGAAGFALDSNQIIFFNGLVMPAAEAGWLYYPLTFLWRTTPLTLAGLLLAVPAYILRWGVFKGAAVRRLVGSALLFVLVFWLFMQMGQKRFDRYLLPAYLFLDLMAGLGWAGAAAALAERVKKAALAPALLLLAALAQLGLALQVYPYAMSYYNPLLGGRGKAPQVMNVGWGEGYDLAAAYLNARPDARELRAMAAMGHGAFSFYFDGQAEWMDLSRIELVDYVVVYIEHQQRCVPQVWCQVMEDIQPEHIVNIDGITYAWIYNQHEFSPQVRQQVLQAGSD